MTQFADASEIPLRIDRVLPRLVAHGIRDEERPRSLEEHLASIESTRVSLGSTALVARPFVGYIDLIFVAPFSEGSYIWINYDHLKNHNISGSEIERIALSNLDALVEEPNDFRWIAGDIGVTFHNFASSFLLSRNFWTALDVDTRRVTAIMPRRDSLVFCTSDNAEDLAYLDSIRERLLCDAEVPDSMKVCEHFVVRDSNSTSGWSLSFSLRQPN